MQYLQHIKTRNCLPVERQESRLEEIYDNHYTSIMENFESEIQEIKKRNERVEADKAWETSLTRRGFIILITYLGALFFMKLNGFENSALQAFIPAGAYILSTLSLPSLKKWWLKRRT